MLPAPQVIKDKTSYRRLLLILSIVWLALNFTVLVWGKVLPWDALDQFYPTVYFNAHSLRSGIAPWWNPYIYGGYAQIGDPQGMLFSPLLMGWMLLLAHPSAHWFAWGILLHVLLGGAAMLALLRRHGANALGALVGATVFMAGGVAASRLEHTPIVIAYAYVPLVLLALRHLIARPGIGRGCLLGLAAGAMVTQLVQVTYLFVLVIVAYACVALARAWRSEGAGWRWRTVGGVLVALVVALALGLPQLVFSWASLSLSNRSDMALSLATDGSLDYRAFLFLLNPNAYDGMRDFRAAPIDPVQSFLYIGVVPLLMLFALGRAWRSAAHRRTIACFAGLSGLAVVYMLGIHTPVYGWLYSWLPGLTHFRRPSDAAYVLNFALAFLAAIGASYIDLRSRREVTTLLVIATVWLALIAALCRLAPHGAPLLAVIVGGLALWRLRTPGTEWRTALWIVALLAADYRSFNLNGTFNTSGNGAARYASHPAVDYLSGALASEDGSPAGRIATQHTTTIWDNMGVLPHIASTQGYNPLRYALYETWYGPRESSNAPSPGSPYNASPSARLDDLLGVRYLVIGDEDQSPTYLPPPSYRKVQSYPHLDIWQNDAAYARFLAPTDVHLLKVGELPDLEAFTATDFSKALWLTPRDEDDRAEAAMASSTCTGDVSVQTLQLAHTRQELRTTSVAGGWVVAGELDHPGWGADIDGEPVPIHRANGMFRAVCVPAGTHRLRFTFHPWRMVAHAWDHLSAKRN